MAFEIRIPKLGLTMLDATVARWLLGRGDRVSQEQAVCVIETDKVTYEVPATGGGLLLPVAAAGTRVEVGGLIGFIAADENELDELTGQHGTESAAVAETYDAGAQKEPAKRVKSAAGERAASGGRIRATPVARALARKHGLELAALSGSGPGGRIVKSDVMGLIERGGAGAIPASYEFGLGAGEADDLSAAEEVPVRGIRRLISRNMRLSLSRQAQLTIHTEASARAMVDLRRLLSGRLGKGQDRVSYNAIIVKAVAGSLRRHPRLNATLDGRTIKLWGQIHIGVAMDFGKGLMVPKIRHADRKSIQELSQELSDLAKRSKKKRLLPDELKNGTFTVTNLGAWDTDFFTPIVNFPESAILGVGRIVEKPWARDGAVVVEPRIALSLTFDHRIIDGAPAAAFLKTVKDMLEEPRLMT